MRKGKFDSLAGIAASGTVGIIGIILIVLLIGGILLIAGGIWYGLFYLLSLLFPAVTFFKYLTGGVLALELHSHSSAQ